MKDLSLLKVVALAGGVGGARMVNGLAQLLSPVQLSIVVNTGDDFEYWGLFISPDLDTVMYTLAGISNPQTGWGLLDEGHRCLENMRLFHQPDWFGLGDRDLATHLTRTQWLREGKSLTEVTRRICSALGVQHAILPMCNEPCCTIAITRAGEMDFQTYFVKEQWQPQLMSLRWEGVSQAQLTPQVQQAFLEADLIIICPSNPFVSIDPILNLPGALEMIRAKPVLAISPIIGGKAVKGPAAKMFRELIDTEASAKSVASYYHHHIPLRGFIIDQQDQNLQNEISKMGIEVLVTNTLLSDPVTQKLIAEVVLDFACHLV
ncbi:MAG: 2-phospho-L-lactate transferase [Chloroflexi bacterium HGW-Chloroflexi-3]|nr:MAG: 2-phospho-L-lactate transferase [Chloroflexi bacterium HGW-Chloroflexi-3]